MRILGIVCSPRKGGNTEILVREALGAVKEAGGETVFIHVADLDISPCDACETCRETGECVIDDGMQEVYREMEEADGIIFGTPVYFINVSAQAKAVMDRTYAYVGTPKLRGKIAAALVAVRRVGAGQVLSLMYSFFSIHRMLIAGGGIGYGREKGEVREGVGGSPVLSALDEARAVGRAVVRLVKNQG